MRSTLAGGCVALILAALCGDHASGQSCEGCGVDACDTAPAITCDSLCDSTCDAMGGCDGFACTGCSSCGKGCFWTSPTMTGNWHGLRSCLQESGISFEGRLSQFGFGIDGGVDQPLVVPILPLGLGDTFRYTGRSEYDFNIDLEKFGGLPFGRLLIRAEHW